MKSFYFCSKTAAEEKLVDIECGMPAKLMFKYNHVDEESKIVVNRKTNRVVANKDKDLKLTFTLKDKKGKTFTSVDSLNIETKVSEQKTFWNQTYDKKTLWSPSQDQKTHWRQTYDEKTH